MVGEESRWVSRSLRITREMSAHATIVQSNPALEFVAAPALAPAEVQVDAALMEVYNKELAAVSYHFCPDGRTILMCCFLG